jgi:predicted peptidase
MMNVKKNCLWGIAASIALLSSCADIENEIKPTIQSEASASGSASVSKDDELTSLPADTGGEHIAKPKGSTSAEFGYYVYLPGGYKNTTKHYPLVIFLHGKSERGNGTTELSRVLNTGIPNLIKNNKWKGKSWAPMIVVSPQYHSLDGKGNENNWAEGNPEQIRKFIEHVIKTYRVNPSRVYITGLSHGGNGVYDYLILQPEATSLIAAAAPIAAYGPNKNHANAKNTPIWVFCGGNDGSIAKKYGNVYTSMNFVSNYNKQKPKQKAKFTVFTGVGHNAWMMTYDLSGMKAPTDPNYTPYSQKLFSWMLQQKRTF